MALQNRLVLNFHFLLRMKDNLDLCRAVIGTQIPLLGLDGEQLTQVRHPIFCGFNNQAGEEEHNPKNPQSLTSVSLIADGTFVVWGLIISIAHPSTHPPNCNFLVS